MVEIQNIMYKILWNRFYRKLRSQIELLIGQRTQSNGIEEILTIFIAFVKD